MRIGDSDGRITDSQHFWSVRHSIFRLRGEGSKQVSIRLISFTTRSTEHVLNVSSTMVLVMNVVAVIILITSSVQYGTGGGVVTALSVVRCPSSRTTTTTSSRGTLLYLSPPLTSRPTNSKQHKQRRIRLRKSITRLSSSSRQVDGQDIGDDKVDKDGDDGSSSRSDHDVMSSSRNNDKQQTGAQLLLRDYLSLIRPVTLLQAVGALLVGYLATVSSSKMAGGAATATATTTSATTIIQLVVASISVYLSYGSGMAINDVVDSNTDAIHELKQSRAIASGRISRRNAVLYTIALSVTSIVLPMMANCGTPYILWTISNLLLMTFYALGLQRLFLIKNIIVGWLGVSPLIGSCLLAQTSLTLTSIAQGPATTAVSAATGAFTKLVKLAIIGFAVGVAREILKDIEDIDVDSVQVGGGKRRRKVTLPIVVGTKISHAVAYTFVAIACILCYTPQYRSIFTSSTSGATMSSLFSTSSSSVSAKIIAIVKSIPYYMISTVAGTIMCFKASLLPIKEGERLLKKSIYVLLAGMISGLIMS